jgi:hypothetical protein
MLHHGVITWDDVSHTFSATAHYPADLLAAPLREMENAWEGSALAKLAVNSLIGLLSIDETKSYKLRSSRHDSDAPAGSVKQVFHYGDETLYDLITADLLISNASTRPLHDLALCSEGTRVGQMLYVMKQSRAVPYELKTDSCLFLPRNAARSSSPRFATATCTSCEKNTCLRSICAAWTIGALWRRTCRARKCFDAQSRKRRIACTRSPGCPSDERSRLRGRCSGET